MCVSFSAQVFSESDKCDFTNLEIHISQIWKSMLSKSVKLGVSQPTIPDS